MAGSAIIGLVIRPSAAILSLAGLAAYGWGYTKLKRVTSLSVFVGAIPGALPPVIGYVAATGRVDSTALALASIQYVWQLPHFWAIAWILRDDYNRAGFHMLPGSGEKERRTAAWIVGASILLVPAGLILPLLGVTGVFSIVAGSAAALWVISRSATLWRTLGDMSARRLLRSTLSYLPLVFSAIVVDRFWV